MSKTPKITSVNFEKTIMAKVKSNEISMKPRWHFVLASLFMIAGFVGLNICAIFLTNLTFFLLRSHGPMKQWRLQMILDSFPLWVPVLAVTGVYFGIWMLRKYDFSYKKNFWLVVVGFIISNIMGAFILDHFGLNDTWSRQGPMQHFYQQLNKQNSTFPERGPGRMQNGRGNNFFRQGQ